MTWKRKLGEEYYRLCSCGARLVTWERINNHRQQGHTVDMKRYKLEGLK